MFRKTNARDEEFKVCELLIENVSTVDQIYPEIPV